MTVRQCCGTHEGQYVNVAYRPGADVAQCMKCKRFFKRNPDFDGRLDWIPYTYVIEELP